MLPLTAWWPYPNPSNRPSEKTALTRAKVAGGISISRALDILDTSNSRNISASRRASMASEPDQTNNTAHTIGSKDPSHTVGEMTSIISPLEIHSIEPEKPDTEGSGSMSKWDRYRVVKQIPAREDNGSLQWNLATHQPVRSEGYESKAVVGRVRGVFLKTGSWSYCI